MRTLVIPLFGALILFSAANAQAAMEFCPAQLSVQAVSSTAQNAAGPATLFGFELTAQGARTVGATLEFDTSSGWFSIDVPPVALVEKDRHFSVGFERDTVRDWVSPVMYVRFPGPVQIEHSWIFSAAATGDGTFGWEKLGRVACPPPPPSMENAYSLRTISYGTSRRSGGTRPRAGIALDAADEDQLSVIPGSFSREFSAVRSSATGTTNCDKPFLEASPVKIVVPAIPDIMAGSPFAGIVGVRIALNANGSLEDAWVWASSGHEAYDAAALSAIRESTYTGAIAYCRPVPSEYNALIMFDPG